MVGVPRSRGCRNCRRKKKGCDKARPACGHCGRLGLTCVYDGRRWTFVNDSAGPPSPPKKASSETRRDTCPAIPSGSGQRSLIRSAVEVQTDDVFWSRYLPKDEPSARHGVGGVVVAPWVSSIRDLAGNDDNVRVAIQACAFTSLGRVQDNANMVQQGLNLYGIALRETNRALQDPVRAESDAVLACCRILGLYEIFRQDVRNRVSTQGTDWQRHVEGTCRIVELRGPKRHVAGHGHALFEDARGAAVISGMTKRRPNFFTSLSWHSIPWESSQRTMRDELYDTMIAIPDLLQRIDQLSEMIAGTRPNADRFQALHQGQEVIGRCIRIGSSLQDWESKAVNLCRETSSSRRRTKSAEEPAESQFQTLRDVCQNHGYGFFHVCALYWSACLTVFGCAWLVHRRITKAVDPSSIPAIPAWLSLPRLPPWMNPEPYAMNIANFSSQYFRDEAGLWGAQNATFPMGAALNYFALTGKQDIPEFEQLTRVFRENKSAQVTGDFLRSMAADAVPDGVKGDCGVRADHRKMACNWYGMGVYEQKRTPSPLSET